MTAIAVEREAYSGWAALIRRVAAFLVAVAILVQPSLPSFDIEQPVATVVASASACEHGSSEGLPAIDICHCAHHTAFSAGHQIGKAGDDAVAFVFSGFSGPAILAAAIDPLRKPPRA